MFVLVYSGHIIAGVETIPYIDGVNAIDVWGKYSGVDYQGIANINRGTKKITTAIVTHNSVAMHIYGIVY